MRPLSAAELLRVWERGNNRAPLEQAILILEAACPDESRSDLLSLAIGERDGRLLHLREWTFGSQVISRAVCPNCGEELELNFDVRDILIESPLPSGSHELELDGYEITFRPPNTSDLIAAAAQKTGQKRVLLERCIQTITIQGATREVDKLPEPLREQVIDAMSESDPQADIHFDLTCPVCEHQWQAPFDVVSYFWNEISVWTRRILREIHVIASAYGWSEDMILGLSPRRRQSYLTMILGGNR